MSILMLFSDIVARSCFRCVGDWSIRTGLQIPKIFLLYRWLVFPGASTSYVPAVERGASEHRSIGHDPRKPNPGRREILAQLRILMRDINRICRFGRRGRRVSFRHGALRFDGAPARRVESHGWPNNSRRRAAGVVSIFPGVDDPYLYCPAILFSIHERVVPDEERQFPRRPRKIRRSGLCLRNDSWKLSHAASFLLQTHGATSEKIQLNCGAE